MAGTSLHSLDRPGAALVTGAGKRLGKAMALALGEAGWAVAVHYNSSTDAAEEVAASIRKAGGDAITVQANLMDEGDAGSLIERAFAKLGRPLNLLVNSASTFDNDSAQTHTRENWDYHMQVNLRAPVLLSQSFASALPAQTKGLIVNLIDQRVLNLDPNFFTYMVSKSALWTATRTMAQALAPNIRVNAIGPGPTLRSVHQSEAEFDAERAATLTGQGASPEEIIKALMYLIDAEAVTGQMIAVDGGQHLMWQREPGA